MDTDTLGDVPARGARHARPTRRAAVPRRRGLAVALAAALGGLAAGAVAPAPVEALGRLPSCDIGDVYTVPREYDDWSVTLVDRLLRVEKDYVPPDLVHVREAGIPGGGYIRGVAIEDTRAMGKAARAAGAPIGVWSAYRSYKEQVQIFTGYTNQYSFENAITYSARPGHSEHQLGLGVDFMSAGGGNPLPGDWATTRAGAWMMKNSWKYGWVLSYPKGEDGSRWNDGSCFRYEPWHYRYLGREMAAKVHDSGLTIREYLWTKHTLLDRTGREVAAATPTTNSPAVSTPETTSPVPPATSTGAVTPSTPPEQAAGAATSLEAQPVVGGETQTTTVVVAGLALAILGGLGLLGWRAVRRRGQGT